MNRLSLVGLVVACLGALACSSSDSAAPGSPDATAPDGASDGGNDGGAPSPGDGGGADAGVGIDAGATSTIAQARTGNVTTPITVVAVVTALHGTPGDYSQWYIEDPAGGPNSGVTVYCDPDLTSCPTIRAPAVNSLVAVTGALSTYKGSLQLVPTAQTVLSANATPPPIATVTMADVAPTGNSLYRGVVVKLATQITVDDTTPSALYDTKCDVASTLDAGADASAVDAGPPLCTGCEPPTYSGFRANDGSGHEIYVEDFFFNTDHLQSSPECTGQAGEIAVTVGKTFSSMTGILDFDPYAGAQQLSPLSDSDYVTP